MVAVAVLSLTGSRLAYALPWEAIFDQGVHEQATRSLRALALSTDDQFFYTGWLHGLTQRAVYRHDATTGSVLNVYSLGTIQANAIAADDRGNVYIGYGENGSGQIEVRGSTLAAQVAVPFNGESTSYVQGLSVWQPNPSTYYLYVSRSDGTIQRFNVTDPSSPGLDTSWTPSGSYTVTGAGQLRGMAVDSDGTIFVVQRDTSGTDRNGFIYCITPSFVQTSGSAHGPMGVAIYDDSLYVSEYVGIGSGIELFDKTDLSTLIETLSTGFDRLDPNIYGYSGIDISDEGYIYVGDEWYNITGYGLDKMWYDRVLTTFPVVHDDDDDDDVPIPEPATLALVALGLAALARRRRRA